METKITKIKKKYDSKTNSNYYVIYFDYFGKERFTYLNKDYIQNWKNKGLNKLNVGLLIMIHKISDKHFKLVGVKNVTF